MVPLAPFARDRCCAVAVSGGADSIALALLAARWGHPTAVVVDHGLRPGSAGEAHEAAERLERLGLPAVTVALDGLHPGPGVSERARKARYGALAAACQARGLVDLLVAHHAQDQAETLLMRAERSSGAAGLASMAAETVRDGVRVLRPLLGIEPGRLRATLRAAGVGWTEDPTNSDLRFARARIRAGLEHAGALEERIGTLLDEARLHGEARAGAERLDAAWAARWVTIRPDGTAHIRADSVPATVLAALVRTVTGRAYVPAAASVAPLAYRLRAATLAGVRLLPAGRLGPGWLLARENAAVGRPVTATAGAWWDGRYRLHAAADLPSAILGALGDDAAGLRHLSRLPAAALRVLPAIRIGDRLAAVPHLRWPDAEACAAWEVRFTPKAPVAGAAFVSSWQHRGCT